MMNQWFPKWYNRLMYPLEKGSFKQIRNDLINKASGQVLELGAGTGINFPLYKNVTCVTAIEPNPFMIEQSIINQKKAVVPIRIIQSNAENLPFENDSFDTVIATLVFCTIPNVEDALNEMHRICKPNGKILLFEHVKMEQPILAKMQIYLTPFWKKICDGCCLDRETVGVLESKGFKIIKLNKFYKGLFVMMEIQN
jgi:ubiquinone/menaquinone biosynthesis C-methylase UbiE